MKTKNSKFGISQIVIVIIVVLIIIVAAGGTYYLLGSKPGTNTAVTTSSTSSTLVSSASLSGTSTTTTQSSSSSAPIGSVLSTYNLCTNQAVSGLVNGSSGGSGCFLEPDGVLYDPSNGYVYVSDASNITVINGATNSFVGYIGNVFAPEQMVYDPSNHYIYVTDGVAATNASSYYVADVSAINTTTNQVVTNITVGSSQSNPLNEWGIALDPTNGYLYVAVYSANNGNISVIDTSSGTVVKTITGIGACINQGVCPPTGVFYDPASGYVYVGHQSSGNITFINTSSNTIVGSLNATSGGGGSPYYFLYDQQKGYVYVADQGSGVTVINPSTNAYIETIGALVYNQQTGQTSYTGGEYTGESPEALALDTGNNYLYSSNFDSNNVIAINTQDNTVLGNIAVGASPRGIAYDPANGDLYVANHFADTVSIISTGASSSGSSTSTSSGFSAILIIMATLFSPFQYATASLCAVSKSILETKINLLGRIRAQTSASSKRVLYLGNSSRLLG